jgi:LCP family protein required for cell wall assembly
MPSFTSISRSTRRTAIKALLGAPIVIASLKKATSVSAENVAAADPRSLGAMNFVVAGLDYRNEWEPENTDVLMVARVDLLANTVRAFSIPRDLWVSIPGYGEDKITRAYDFGSANAGRDFKAGADAISATIEANFGIPIDAAVMTTFGGFERIVDAFGGVDVNNPYDLYDGQYPTDDYGIKEIFYPAGEIKLSGEQALEFCRTRHQDGDDGRTMRQRIVLRALLDEARQLDSATLQDLVLEHRNTIRTNLGRSKQLALALAAPDFSNSRVDFATLSNYIWPSTAWNGAWIYAGDWGSIPSYTQGFLNGEIAGNA